MHRAAKTAAILLAAAAAGNAAAQYAVDVDFEYGTYLQFEKISARVRVRNDTSQTLVIGGAQRRAVLQMIVGGQDGRPLERIAPGLLLENELVTPSDGREFQIDLRRYFGLQQPGTYTVRAALDANGVRFVSSVRALDIVPGLEILSLDRPLPEDAGRVLTYGLRYWERGQREYLFLCVREKARNTSLGVMPLGPVVRFMTPELTVSGSGNVLVRHQSSEGGIASTTFQSTGDGIIFLKQEVTAISAPPRPEERRRSGSGTSGPHGR